MPKKALETRRVLMHVSHDDPQWCAEKDSEGPFDPDVAVEIRRRHGGVRHEPARRRLRRRQGPRPGLLLKEEGA